MKTEIPTVGVVVVTYQSARSIAANWSAFHDVDTPIKMCVIDNASTDNTIPLLQRAGVPVHVNPINVGFTAATNQGVEILLQACYVDWIILLNPDVTPPKNYPTAFLSDLTDNEKAGVIGMRLTDLSGSLTHAGGMLTVKPMVGYWPMKYDLGNSWAVVQKEAMGMTRFNHSLDEKAEPAKCPWVSFGCAAVSVPMIREIGLLNEEYFLLCSDSEYCIRAQANGWEVWYNPVTCVHEGGASMREAGSEVHEKAQADIRRFAVLEDSLWEQPLPAGT